MKTTTLYLLIFFLSSCSHATETIKLGVMSDSHYLSEQLMENGTSLKKYENSSGRNIWDAPQIIESVLTDFENSGIEVLLIPGDMTKDGEKQSHKDFVAKLQPLLDKGVKILVIPGNHDILVPFPIGFNENGTYAVENITADEFASIYADCGYKDALSRDTASLSYLTELNKSIWLLAIDSNLYKEATDRTITAGRISPETEKWILESLNEAKLQGKKVMGMMHHGLTEHILLQDMLFPQYLVDDWRRLAGLFADNGMKFIFTGHFHSNDITEFVSDNGNKIYDVETGALTVFPYPYRLINITGNEVDITTRNIKTISGNPDLTTTGRASLKKLAEGMVKQKLREKKYNASEDLLNEIADLGSEIIILHTQGDEVINDDIKEKIKVITNKIDIPIDLSPDFLQLDFPPADNNVKLFFGK